jgi:phospholipid-binding lipoprotein MlaA
VIANLVWPHFARTLRWLSLVTAMKIISSALGVALLCMFVSGCASMAPSGPIENDPFERTNRVLFDYTIRLDKAVIRPTAFAYRWAVPQDVRNSIRNVLNNFSSPGIFANDLLQGELDRAGVTALRAGVNTTLGIGGILDVAARWGYVRHSEDLGQTLAVYGVPEGPYIFVPILGPGNPRDLLGYVLGFVFNPISYIQWGNEIYVPYLINAVDLLDVRERNIETLNDVEMNSLDYYASVRSLYRQTRTNEIRNGAMQIQDLPDF